MISLLLLHSSLSSHETFVPERFREGQPIESIILISDVDGVIRESTDGMANPDVVLAIKRLIEDHNVDVTFISGTPVENDLTLERWRRGNVPLSHVFGLTFSQELKEKKVEIYGVLGGHRMQEDGTLEVVDEYSLDMTWEICCLLIKGFLKEVLEYGNDFQKDIAEQLQDELSHLPIPELETSHTTPQEFEYIIERIRQYLDPDFRLLSNGALIETQTSYPLWHSDLSSKWLREQMNTSHPLLSQLPSQQKHIATGIAKRDQNEFNYLLVSKTNKGLTTKKLIEEKLQKNPNALVVTIGDTQVDFSMHVNADMGFHVGLERSWKNYDYQNCMMIRNEKGEDAQHIEGTLKVLSLLEEAIGKSFYDFKYLPKQDANGKWGEYSINEVLNQIEAQTLD